jgi:hypothetical protein
MSSQVKKNPVSANYETPILLNCFIATDSVIVDHAVQLIMLIYFRDYVFVFLELIIETFCLSIMQFAMTQEIVINVISPGTHSLQ